MSPIVENPQPTVSRIKRYRKAIVAFIPALVALLASFDVVVPGDVSDQAYAVIGALATVAVAVVRNASKVG